MKRKGLVGFFDILAYQNIIRNNDIEAVANIISNILVDLPQNVKNDLHKIATREKPADASPTLAKLIDELIKNITHLIISDSIIVTLPYDESYSKHQIQLACVLFTLYCGMLEDAAFSKGLPLRGAIACGDFFIKGSCVAGKPIIDAYALANELEMSGCAFCESASGLVDETIPQYRKFNLWLKYLVPLKNNRELKMYTLNWASSKPRNFGDIRQYVIEAFHAHNKDIPSTAKIKVINTEDYIRYSIAQIK